MAAEYYIDKKTRNYSFIEMHYFLQDIGCENNDFMLRTYDKDLLDFNIHEFFAKAGKDEKSKLNDKIITECKKNIWFYLREIVRFYDKDRYVNYPLYMGEPFILTKENIKLIYLFANGISFTSIYGYDKNVPNMQFDYMNTMRILSTYASDVLGNNIIKNENEDYSKIVDKYPKIRCDYIFGKNDIIDKDEENDSTSEDKIKDSKKLKPGRSRGDILVNNFISAYDLGNIQKINKAFSDILFKLFTFNITKNDNIFKYHNAQKIYSSVLLDTYKYTEDDFKILNEISAYSVLKQISYTYFGYNDYTIFDDDISKMSKNHIIIERLY